VDGNQEIESELGEVSQLFAIERLGHQMADHQANTAKSTVRAAHSVELGQLQGVCIPEDHSNHAATPIDEQADASVQFMGELEKISSESGAHDAVGGHGPLS
jgi:hypothetical protein